MNTQPQSTPAISPGLPLRWAPAWVLACVALWPLHGFAELLLDLGALSCLASLLLRRFRGGTHLLSGPAWALTSVLFFTYWLPEVWSSLDAVDTWRSLKEVLIDLRYLPFLWLVAAAVATAEGCRKTFTGLGMIALLWTADALLEAALGHSPLFWLIDHARLAVTGHTMCAGSTLVVDRLGGVLGPCNLKLGIVLASLSPFALNLCWQRFGRLGWLLAALGIGMVILLAGSRASWITYALVLAWTGWQALGGKRLVLLFATGAVLLGLATEVSPQVRGRMQLTAQALSANASGVDAALTGRGRIWSAALCMAREHPINGVGVRGFRDAFPGCDPQPGVVAAWGTGVALHAHQIVLEVLSETGVIGLLIWLAGAALAWRAWRFADAAARTRARPAMLALAVSVFPLNTHLAAYSTFWGGVLLLLAGLYAGSLLGRDAD
jgi:O-antigen ligase